MIIRDFIKELQSLPETAKVRVSSDEELNTIFADFRIGVIDEKNGRATEVVIYGLSGSQID